MKVSSPDCAATPLSTLLSRCSLVARPSRARCRTARVLVLAEPPFSRPTSRSIRRAGRFDARRCRRSHDPVEREDAFFAGEDSRVRAGAMPATSPSAVGVYGSLGGVRRREAPFICPETLRRMPENGALRAVVRERSGGAAAGARRAVRVDSDAEGAYVPRASPWKQVPSPRLGRGRPVREFRAPA